MPSSGLLKVDDDDVINCSDSNYIIKLLCSKIAQNKKAGAPSTLFASFLPLRCILSCSMRIFVKLSSHYISGFWF